MPIPKNISFCLTDDFPSIRKMLVAHLTDLGFTGNKHEFEGPTSALQFLEMNPVDFILSDWQMPDMSGLDFLRKVKANPKLKEIPFMLITTVNEKANVIEAIQAGATNYLIKPWTKESLLEKLEQCWAKHHK